MNIAFSTIGACIARPVVRMEGYSPRARAFDSLDMVVYACQEHIDTARAEWLAGLNVSGTRVQGRRCGDAWTSAAPSTGEPLNDAVAPDPSSLDLSPGEPVSADAPAGGWCHWHKGPSGSAVAVRALETGSGPGWFFYACAPCREQRNLTPLDDGRDAPAEPPAPDTREAEPRTSTSQAAAAPDWVRRPGEMPRDVHEKAVTLVAGQVLRRSRSLDYSSATTEQLAHLVGTLTRSLGDVLGILDGTTPGPLPPETDASS